MDAMCFCSGHAGHDMIRLLYQEHLRPASPAAHCTESVSMQTFAATFYGLLETGNCSQMFIQLPPAENLSGTRA